MPIQEQAKVSCPSCGAGYRWKPELAGRKVQCRCGAVMRMPTGPGSPAQAAATPKPAASAAPPGFKPNPVAPPRSESRPRQAPAAAVDMERPEPEAPSKVAAGRMEKVDDGGEYELDAPGEPKTRSAAPADEDSPLASAPATPAAPPTSPAHASGGGGGAGAAGTTGVFAHPTYLIRKKVFKIFGAAFHVYDPAGQLAFFVELKAFKLKEDIRVYADESKSTELLSIKARQIIDFSASYDVIDTRRNQKVGALRRKGLKSVFQDEWTVLDAGDREIGKIAEDSVLLALVRRFVDMASLLLPQKYHGDIHGQRACVFKQNFNPFVGKITMDFTADSRGVLDRRLGVAAGILLCAVEGKQK